MLITEQYGGRERIRVRFRVYRPDNSSMTAAANSGTMIS